MIRVQFLAETNYFSLLHGIQTGSGAHTASNAMVTEALSPEGEVAGA
jgi:hypothetical protein